MQKQSDPDKKKKVIVTIMGWKLNIQQPDAFDE